VGEEGWNPFGGFCFLSPAPKYSTKNINTTTYRLKMKEEGTVLWVRPHHVKQHK
jgi:hypothetical protein